ncbi:cysteine desulfurase family protein [Planctomycetota bacterium]
MIFWPRNVYLDNNATTPIAREVRKAMDAVLKKKFGNASSLHTHGRNARGLVDKARASVAELLNCEPERIIFTSGGTEGNNTVIKGVFMAQGRGHIITSKIEHDSVLGACKQIEEMGGNVTYVCAGKHGLINPEDVRAALRDDTILISIMHANNETGVIQPIQEISDIAKEKGIPFHTDAVQTYGKIKTDVNEIGCDFLTLSAHKINGPKGVGVIYWKGTYEWDPLIAGGDQEHGLRTGTEGTHQIAGLGTAAKLAKQRMDLEFSRLSHIRKQFLNGLKKVAPNTVINETVPEKQLPGTINATFPGREGLRLLAGLDCYEVSVSIGSACTADRIEPSHVLLGMGLSEEEALSTIRISMGTATT